MKGYKIDLNIDITEATKLDPSIAMIPLTAEEKGEYREKLDMWEKGGKKGERPVFDVKYFSAAEVCRIVILDAITQVYPTGNAQLLKSVRDIDAGLSSAILNDGGVLKTSQEVRNLIRSCFARAEKWDNTSAAVRCLVGQVKKVVDESTEFVEIDRA